MRARVVLKRLSAADFPAAFVVAALLSAQTAGAQQAAATA